LRYSYKLYCLEPLDALLGEQKEVAFKETSAYINEEETDEFPAVSVDDYDPRAAIEAAKRRAYIPNPKRPTSRSRIIVSEGEGRATRELELQWWPNHYKVKFGKLTFRFFVQKKLY
jgi:hypothetical protein